MRPFIEGELCGCCGFGGVFNAGRKEFPNCQFLEMDSGKEREISRGKKRRVVHGRGGKGKPVIKCQDLG